VWKPMDRALVLFFILGIFVHSSLAQGGKDKTTVEIDDFACGLTSSGESFSAWQDLSIIPVKFSEKNKEGTILDAYFASDFLVERKTFTISNEKKPLFYKIDGDWSEAIDAKEFLKIFKKEFWLVSYIPTQNNVVCQAFQFRDWRALEASFGQDYEEIRNGSILGTVHDPAFFKNIRVAPFSFVSIEDEKALWLFVLVVNGSSNPFQSKTITLENGLTYNRRGRSRDGFDIEVTDYGSFELGPKIVFETAEYKFPRFRWGNYSLGNVKVRSKLVDRVYFEKNMTNFQWLCFYDYQTGKILRLAEMMPEISSVVK